MMYAFECNIRDCLLSQDESIRRTYGRHVKRSSQRAAGIGADSQTGSHSGSASIRYSCNISCAQLSFSQGLSLSNKDQSTSASSERRGENRSAGRRTIARGICR